MKAKRNSWFKAISRFPPSIGESPPWASTSTSVSASARGAACCSSEVMGVLSRASKAEAASAAEDMTEGATMKRDNEFIVSLWLAKMKLSLNRSLGDCGRGIFFTLFWSWSLVA